jgi:hypothetical protein
LRYLIRAPTDGSLLGRLNAQYFKALAIPSGMSGVYLWHRFRRPTGALDSSIAEPWVKIMWISLFLVAFTALEVAKASTYPGLTLVDGERSWLNHALHVTSAVASYYYVTALSMDPLLRGQGLPDRQPDQT